MVLREKLVKVYSLIIIAWLQECGGYSGFQVIMGMMELGRNPKYSVRFPTPPVPPKKRINGLKVNPPPAGPNTTTTTTTVTTKRQTELRGRHTRAPSDCQTTQENICQIFLPPKISESKNLSLNISSDSSRHLKSRVTSPAPPSPSRVLDFDTVLCVSPVFKIRNWNPIFCLYLFKAIGNTYSWINSWRKIFPVLHIF